MMILLRNITAALLLIGLFAAENALAVTIPVSSSDSASWDRSNGGTGTAMPIGGPGVWNSQFVVSIPPGATNIAFTIDSLAVDDKGVAQVNGTTVGDAVIFGANGAAAGSGTFDYGQGGGSQPYTFAGFTPGTATGLPNGTTDVTVTVYVNDTGTSNPSAPPFDIVTVASSFNFSGSLTYDVGSAAPGPVAVTALSGWSMFLLVMLTGILGIARSRDTG